MKDAVMDAMSQLAVAVFSELKTGGNVPHHEAAPQATVAAAPPPARSDVAMFGTDFCKWLPTDFLTPTLCAGYASTP